ncbi:MULTISPECIES: hypothetical protein, partial [unclassified Moraxella]|uniref:hypothetical protein n=1 Tax=unclassified Moraxella TaxID=2685852 RepID=UPI00359E4B68
MARGHQRTQTGSTSLSKDPTQTGSSFRLNPIASAIDSLKPAVRSLALTTLLLSGLSFSGSVSAQQGVSNPVAVTGFDPYWAGNTVRGLGSQPSETLVWGGKAISDTGFKQADNPTNIGAGGNFRRGDVEALYSIVIGHNTYLKQSGGGSNIPHSTVIIGHGAMGKGLGVEGAIALGARALTGGRQTISIGADSHTVSSGNISIGSQAYTSQDNSLAIGTGSRAEHSSIAIGNSAQADNASIVVGYFSSSDVENGTVVGIQAVNSSKNGTVVGFKARVETGSTDGIAIGRSAKVDFQSKGAIAFGSGAKSKGMNSLAFGTAATAKGSSVAIGNNAQANNQSVVIGYDSTGQSSNGVVLGINALNKGDNSTVIGYEAKLSDDSQNRALENSLVVGTSARAWSGHSVVLGREAQVGDTTNDAVGGTAVGERAYVYAKRGTALGNNTRIGAGGVGGVAIGRSATVNAQYGIAIGSGHPDNGNTPATVNAEGGIAIGHNANVKADQNRAVAIGYSATAGGKHNVAIGYAAQASGISNVAIGTESQATDVSERGNLVIGNKTFDANQWRGYNQTGSFAVASGGKERVIQHVAAGTISSSSTEAINGSQLYRIVEGIGFDVYDNNNTRKATVGIGNKVTFKQGRSGLVSVATALDGNANGSKNNAQVTFDVVTQGFNSANNRTTVTATGGTAGLAKSADVATAINNVSQALINKGWRLKVNRSPEQTVKLGETVNFQQGKNVGITQAGKTVTINAWDTQVEVAAGSNDFFSIADKGQPANNLRKYELSVNDAFKQKIAGFETDINNLKKNPSGSWILAVSRGTGGSSSGASSQIKFGETATFKAGKNVKLTQTGRTIDIAVVDSPSFTSMSTSGTATIGGKLTARSGLDVTGATTLRNTLNVTGDTTLRGTTAN